MDTSQLTNTHEERTSQGNYDNASKVIAGHTEDPGTQPCMLLSAARSDKEEGVRQHTQSDGPRGASGGSNPATTLAHGLPSACSVTDTQDHYRPEEEEGEVHPPVQPFPTIGHPNREQNTPILHKLRGRVRTTRSKGVKTGRIKKPVVLQSRVPTIEDDNNNAIHPYLLQRFLLQTPVEEPFNPSFLGLRWA